MYTESPPLNDTFPERDVDASDPDAERASSNRVHRLRPDTAYRSSGFKNAQFKSDRPSISRRLTRSLVRFFLAVLIGIGGTLAWQSYGDEMVRAWAPSLDWLLPASTMKAPAPAVTSAELQEKLKPVALDVAIVRRSVEQLASNQDQLARKQEQMAQAIAALQAAEQDISQKISTPPPPKTVHVPPPKPPQPAAQ
ncbi:MAG TPA: hypothetical protein VK653_04895 [Xanthobacteraceae bacterium]|nr:hypothetical protein [Xanthobacteraceae bacterium]